MQAFGEDLQQRFASDGEGRGVNLLTFHRAKGLEFDAVFLPRLQEGELPFRRSKTDEAVEEERRLLYVGITRARRYLAVSFVADGRSKPSRFVTELRGRTDGAALSGTADTAPARRSGGTSGRASVELAPGAEPAFEALRSWRLERARADAVPPYVVFHDRTLADIARERPASRTGLATIAGIGSGEAGTLRGRGARGPGRAGRPGHRLTVRHFGMVEVSVMAFLIRFTWRFSLRLAVGFFFEAFVAPLSLLPMSASSRGSPGRRTATGNPTPPTCVTPLSCPLRPTSDRCIAAEGGGEGMTEGDRYGWWRVGGATVGVVFDAAFRLRYTGLANVPRSGGALLTYNHVSVLDPVVVGLGADRRGRSVRFLSLAEAFDQPLVGFGLRRTRQIPLRRGLGDWKALETVADAIRAGSLCGLSPEGTVGPGDALQPLQKGAARIAIAHRGGR